MMINHIVTSSLVIVFVMLIGKIFETKINARLKYSLWLLVVVKLLVPFSDFESPLHVLNFIGTFADSNISSESEQTIVYNFEEEIFTEEAGAASYRAIYDQILGESKGRIQKEK